MTTPAEVAESLALEDIPIKLRCASCNKLAQDAVRLPCCDQNICGECQATKLDLTCPICYHEPVSADDCRPNKALRQTVKIFLKRKLIDRETAAKKKAEAQKAQAEAEASAPAQPGQQASSTKPSDPDIQESKDQDAPADGPVPLEQSIDVPTTNETSTGKVTEGPGDLEATANAQQRPNEEEATAGKEENQDINQAMQFMPNGMQNPMMPGFPNMGMPGMGMDPMTMQGIFNGFGGPGMMNGFSMGMGFDPSQGFFGGLGGGGGGGATGTMNGFNEQQQAAWNAGNQDNFNQNGYAGAEGNFQGGNAGFNPGYNMHHGNFNQMSHRDSFDQQQYGYQNQGYSRGRGLCGRGNFAFAGRGRGNFHNQYNPAYTNNANGNDQQVAGEDASQAHPVKETGDQVEAAEQSNDKETSAASANVDTSEAAADLEMKTENQADVENAGPDSKTEGSTQQPIQSYVPDDSSSTHLNRYPASGPAPTSPHRGGMHPGFRGRGRGYGRGGGDFRGGFHGQGFAPSGLEMQGQGVVGAPSGPKAMRPGFQRPGAAPAETGLSIVGRASAVGEVSKGQDMRDLARDRSRSQSQSPAHSTEEHHSRRPSTEIYQDGCADRYDKKHSSSRHRSRREDVERDRSRSSRPRDHRRRERSSHRSHHGHDRDRNRDRDSDRKSSSRRHSRHRHSERDHDRDHASISRYDDRRRKEDGMDIAEESELKINGASRRGGLQERDQGALLRNGHGHGHGRDHDSSSSRRKRRADRDLSPEDADRADGHRNRDEYGRRHARVDEVDERSFHHKRSRYDDQESDRRDRNRNRGRDGHDRRSRHEGGGPHRHDSDDEEKRPEKKVVDSHALEREKRDRERQMKELQRRALAGSSSGGSSGNGGGGGGRRGRAGRDERRMNVRYEDDL